MSLSKSSRTSATGRPARSGRGKSAQPRVATGRARVKIKVSAKVKAQPGKKIQKKAKAQSKLQTKADARRQEPMESEWEEMSESLELIPGVEEMLENPAASYGTDAEARRRIEMLREERLLQQTLSDVFDL